MKPTVFLLSILIFVVTACSPSEPPNTAVTPDQSKTTIDPKLVEDAYVWGLPIVTMYRYYKLMGPQVNGLNQLAHNRKLSVPGQFSGGPNRDGLYSFGWFDLNDEPFIVSLPDFGDRYFIWQMTDMYEHNFANIGVLREGGKEAYSQGYTFAMVGPNWQGELPDGIDAVVSPVNVVNVLYRIEMNGEGEYEIGNRLQDETHTLPLSAWVAGERETVAKAPSNPIPEYRDVLVFKPGVSGADQRNPLFFSVLADAIAANEPYAAWDKEFVATKLSELGVVPGEDFDFSSLGSADQEAILDAQERAFDRVIATGDKEFGVKMNGWLQNPLNHGDWGDHYQNRAYGTYTGGMYPVTNNSTYASAYYDENDEPLDGRNTYTLRFDSDDLPPVTHFWSITAYDAGTRDLFPNPAGLYHYGSNNPATKYEEDGSVEFIISNVEPANSSEVNWLPVPEEGIWLIVRYYAPTDEVLNLQYELPGIQLLK
jgi:hypothetical protein